MHAVEVWGFHDPVSGFAHLASAVLAAVVTVPLMKRALASGRGVASATFALGVVTLFVLSGTYHLLGDGPARAFFRRLDHAAIFFLIAATFTPVLAEHFSGVMRNLMLVAIWGFGLAGIILKTVFFDVASYEVGLVLYLGMGWSGLAVGLLALRRSGVLRMVPMAVGGLVYTLGAVLDFLNWPILMDGYVGPHELFHLCVSAAAACHWFYVHESAGRPALAAAR